MHPIYSCARPVMPAILGVACYALARILLRALSVQGDSTLFGPVATTAIFLVLSVLSGACVRYATGSTALAIKALFGAPGTYFFVYNAFFFGGRSRNYEVGSVPFFLGLSLLWIAVPSWLTTYLAARYCARIRDR